MSPSDKIIENALQDGSKTIEEAHQSDLQYAKGQLEAILETPESIKMMQDMEAIRTALQWLKEDGLGLEVEVIYWALKEMKADPTLSIGDAISLGFTEWDK